MTAGRPLTDAQERVLISLVDLARDDRDAGSVRQWRSLGIQKPTLDVLVRAGLIERRSGRVRATDAGVALCDGMGD